ncbi:Uncharacterised protein [Vibrio cholerae]|nr:Uncharacterised protein [Vibrio cholerae]
MMAIKFPSSQWRRKPWLKAICVSRKSVPLRLLPK